MPLPEVKPLTKADSDSLIFKAAEFLNRSNSAAMGAVTELLSGGDPIEAAGQSLLGKQVYGGQDVMASLFGGSPDDKLNRRVGLAADILNPLDPLNYLGIGTLTKAGKAAKLAKGVPEAAQLVKGAAAQTKAGQRGLLTFAGQRVPLPGDAAILGKIERVGEVVKQSKAGRGLARKFGGREAALQAELDPILKAAGVDSAEEFDRIIGAHNAADRVAATYKNPTSALIDEVQASLSRKDYDAFRELLDHSGRAGNFMDESAKFIGAGPGAAKRRKAVEAAQKFFAEHGSRARQVLGEEGIGGMASDAPGYLPHIRRLDKNADIKKVARFYGTPKTGEVEKLQGAADNPVNRSLIPGSEEPISRTMLTQAGKRQYDELTAKNPEYFEHLRRNDPAKYAEWSNKNRVSITEAMRLLEAENLGTYEGNPITLMRHIQDMTAQKMRTTALVEQLQNARTFDDRPLVRPWNDLSPTERRSGDWIMVSQGKWRDHQLAVPKIYGEAFEKFNEVFMPGPDQALFGELLNEVLPTALNNAGLMSWWKNLTLFMTPLGNPAYLSRNLVSAMLKNSLEGMTMPDFARLVPEAAHIAGQSLKSRLNANVGWASGQFVTKQGVKIDREWIMRQYWDRNFHGGGHSGFAASELFDEARNVSSVAREKLFGAAHRGNFRVEMIARLPLMLKYIEDTFDVAQKAGVRLPEQIGMATEVAPRGLVDVALTNAREAVIRSHFDYEDLTPFEKKLRARWVPFYTWMRKNIPHETLNMIQQPSKYMPFARYYYNSFEQQEIAPEDLPQWASRAFAAPISPGEGDRARWLDWTGFLPFMDVAELGQTAAVATGLAKPELGSTRPAEVIRYMAVRSNPFITQLAEQGLQKSFFTRRSFSGDMPADVMGRTVGQPTRNALNLLQPVMQLDRVNPMDIFGATPRPHRNEPGQGLRALRALTGIKTYATDKDEASMSYRRVQREVQQLQAAERRELREGNVSGAQYIRERRERLQKGIR